ncbi:MAG: LysR family transcriptional regulator [Oscillospiraceae bacterium]|nr:LysR family transcriptional regulator [Oscillospiraceae bacterium]
MTLNQMIYFQKIAQLGNMGRAARVLNISQPSLSVAISNLEKELNLSLFLRDGRKLMLSAEGRQFLAHVEGILADVQEAQLHMQSLSANRDVMIRIGCISPLMLEALPRTVRAFLSKPGNRHMKVDFRTDNTSALITRLRDGYCDLLLCSMSKEEDLVQTELSAEPYVLLSPPGREVPQTWDDLFSQDVIGFQEQTRAFSEIQEMLGEYDIASVYTHNAPDEASIAALVSYGFGYGIVPKVPLLKNYDLQISPLPAPNGSLTRRIYLTRLVNRPPVGAAKRFVKYLLTHGLEE